MVNTRMLEPKKGWIELITGCMFAGKTEEFIKRLRRHYFGKRNIITFKPIIDNRYSENQIASHSGLMFPSFPINDSKEIKEIFLKQNKKQKIDVVGIDEIQFLDENVVELVEWLADQQVIVIVAGLDKDFRSHAFKNVDKLLYIAEYVDKLQAVCHVCGANANRTQRIVDGKPAKASDPLILVSGNEQYEARCRFDYIQPK